jgi:hypothetical protein
MAWAERTAEGGVSSGKSSGEFFVLTPKGAQELHNRHHEFDATAKNILQLIEQGAATAEAILERSMFPHNAVIEGLRRLLGNKLITAAADGAAAPHASGKPASARSGRRELRLKFGISPTQARFALSNFCMDHFGAEERYLVDAVSLCNDVMTLQEVLNSVRAEVDERFPDCLPALFDCVREINETDEAASPAASAPAAPARTASARPASARPAAGEPAAGKSASNKPAASTSGSSLPDPMRLESGVSLAQARFTLSEFCLNQFGVGGQELVDAVNQCRDVQSLQKVLNLIRTEVLNHHRDRVPALAASVHEINETAL